MIEPYWTSKDGRHFVYCGDCMKIITAIDSVDAVVTDPPYGIGESSRRDFASRSNIASADKYNRSNWDDKPCDQRVIDWILSNSTYQIIWGGNYFKLPPTSCYLVWDKMNGDNDFADCELAWTNMKMAVRRLQLLWSGFRRVERNITRQHPTQKPVGLMTWAINFLPDAQTILDPFMGSGTTGVACVRLNRRFIGIEISKEYCDIAVERIKRELSQPRLELEPQPSFEQTKLFDEVE